MTCGGFTLTFDRRIKNAPRVDDGGAVNSLVMILDYHHRNPSPPLWDWLDWTFAAVLVVGLGGMVWASRW